MGNPDLSEINWFRLYQFKTAAIHTKIDAIQLIGDGIYTEVELTVNSGSGSGFYEPGERVQIRAQMPQEGQVFDRWVVNAGTLQVENPESFTTYVTIEDTDAEITAGYIADPNVAVGPGEIIRECRLFPNPAQDEVQLMFDLKKSADVSITIYGLAGQIVRNGPEKVKLIAGEQHMSISISDLTPGGYLLNIDCDGICRTRLLLKD